MMNNGAMLRSKNSGNIRSPLYHGWHGCTMTSKKEILRQGSVNAVSTACNYMEIRIRDVYERKTVMEDLFNFAYVPDWYGQLEG